jgi:hypothetical protein
MLQCRPYTLVAQLVEHRIPNPRVGGSIPSERAVFCYVNSIFLSELCWRKDSDDGHGAAAPGPRSIFLSELCWRKDSDDGHGAAAPGPH